MNRDAYKAAHALLLQIERELALAQGESYAVPLDFPIKWDIGAPHPHLLVSDNRCVLLFRVHQADANWDGTYVTVNDASRDAAEPFALVEFARCLSAKLGSPNDEAQHGHPLHGKGLERYTAQRVVNSSWIQELQAINSVHRLYQAERWQSLNHYIFWFHDSTFECIAESYHVEVHETNLTELLAVACRRLIP